MITSKRTFLELQEKYPPFGIKDTYGLRRIHRTSGTTDKALFVALNEVDIEMAHRVGARCFRNAGVRDDIRVAHCLSFQGWSGGMMDCESLQLSGASVLPWGTGGTSLLIRMILDLGITGISCTPSYMNVIKKVLKDEYGFKPEQLGLKLGLFGGEGGLQYQEFRSRLEEEWGMVAINANYGLSEVMSMIASENYIEKSGLKFLANDCLEPLILVDDELLIPKKGVVGELVLTTIYEGGLNKKYRYRTGDVVSITSDSNNFTFEVIGRTDEMIVIKGVNIYPSVLSEIVVGLNMSENTSYAFQLQVSKKDPIDSVVLKLGATNSDELIALENSNLVNELIKSKIGLNIPVDIVPIESIMNVNNKVKPVSRIL